VGNTVTSTVNLSFAQVKGTMASTDNTSPQPQIPAEPQPAAGPSSAPDGPQPRITRAAEAEALAQQLDSDPSSHRYQCRSCGYVYDPSEGVAKLGIPQGTPFDALPDTFLCPVCRSTKAAFVDAGPRNRPSGFTQNLDYGLGVNRLTPGQKTVLIFGGFMLAVAFLLSFYALR